MTHFPEVLRHAIQRLLGVQDSTVVPRQVVVGSFERRRPAFLQPVQRTAVVQGVVHFAHLCGDKLIKVDVGATLHKNLSL